MTRRTPRSSAPASLDGQTDLLDLLAGEATATQRPEPRHEDGLVHALMPWMRLPDTCGADFLRLPPGQTWSTHLSQTTCPRCLAAGELVGIAAAAQRRQARQSGG